MAVRKQFMTEAAVDEELMQMLVESRHTPVTDAQLAEQRISFAYGNAPASQFITKDSVRLASGKIRLEP